MSLSQIRIVFVAASGCPRQSLFPRTNPRWAYGVFVFSVAVGTIRRQIGTLNVAAGCVSAVVADRIDAGVVSTVHVIVIVTGVSVSTAQTTLTTGT